MVAGRGGPVTENCGMEAESETSRSGALPEFEMLSVCDWVCPTTTELKWRLLTEILSEGASLGNREDGRALPAQPISNNAGSAQKEALARTLNRDIAVPHGRRVRTAGGTPSGSRGLTVTFWEIGSQPVQGTVAGQDGSVPYQYGRPVRTCAR